MNNPPRTERNGDMGYLHTISTLQNGNTKQSDTKEFDFGETIARIKRIHKRSVIRPVTIQAGSVVIIRYKTDDGRVITDSFTVSIGSSIHNELEAINLHNYTRSWV